MFITASKLTFKVFTATNGYLALLNRLRASKREGSSEYNNSNGGAHVD
jgi:hypothetical protein